MNGGIMFNIVDDLIEVELKNSDDFLKVKETLTRIGIPSKREKVLYQSCHILHKQGKYYIVHFKELFALDGKPSNFSENDKARRNTIVGLLSDWGLLNIIQEQNIEDKVPLNQLKILSFKEKDEWTLMPKYNIGNKKRSDDGATESEV
tara:strand:- start:147 stop:590 length:444 start_codon:yes stop_codon:yes gene_type:complete